MASISSSAQRPIARRLRRATLLVLALGAAALVVGCESNADRPSRFIFANASAYDTLDPHQSLDVGHVAARLNLYDGLYRWVDNPPQLMPWLAESHTVSPDGRKWTFRLRRGAKFHDGAEVTAADVVYSTERIFGIGKGAAALLARMLEPGNTRALDAYTVQFTLTRPAAIFLSIVPEIPVVNAALVRQHEQDGDWGAAWLSLNDAGSGSYVLERFDPAVGWSAKRHDGHFLGWGENPLPEIEFRFVPEINARVQGMIAGDYHGTGGFLPFDQVRRLQEAKQVQVLEQESMRLFMFQLNNQRAPTSDVNVRRAISHAFNYDAFINEVLDGSVARNPMPIPNNLWGLPQDVRGYAFDLDKARAELAKAEVKVDRELTIGALTGYAHTGHAATLLQDGLRQIGIRSRIESRPWPVMVGRMKEPATSPDIVIYWISTYYADPHNWIGEMFHSGGWGSFKSSSFYRNPKVDALLDRALRSTERAVREQAYQDAARIVVDEAAGVWVYNTKWFGPYAANVQGVRFSPVGNGQEMRWVSFK